MRALTHTLRPWAAAICLTTATATLAGCSLGGGEEGAGSGDATEATSSADAPEASASDAPGDTGGSSGSSSTGSAGTEGSSAGKGSGTVTLVTHDSFNPPEGVLEAFTKETGTKVEVVASGDAGTLTNKLVLTKGDPIGDVVFGIDNTFGGRALDEGVLAAADVELPSGVEQHALGDDAGEHLVPVDYGDVCVNIDDTWFDKKGINPPKTLDDLTKPEYEDLFVTPGAATSSPGMAFLLATVGAQGEDGWEQYWQELMGNGAKVTAGWEDAYSVDFTAGGGGGDRPIVLSYASSPPFTVPEGGEEPTTSALLDTCFRQVEYAGVLEGTDNPEGARELVEFLVGEEFQAGLPDSMYVYPVRDDVELPEAWADWAPPAKEPIELDAATINDKRADWLTRWSEATGQ